MAVKGAIRIIVLVVPHVELYSRHQDVLDSGKSLCFEYSSLIRYSQLQSATLRSVGV